MLAYEEQGAGDISIHSNSADRSQSGNPSGTELILSCSLVLYSRESILGLRKQQQPEGERGKRILALNLNINHLSCVTKETCAILVKLSI